MFRRDLLASGIAAFFVPRSKVVIDRRTNPIPVTRIGITNHSTVVSDAEYHRMVTAVAYQVEHHVAPSWRIVPPMVGTSVGAGVCEVRIVDRCDAPGAIAYHTDRVGVPYGLVGAKTAMDDDTTVSGALSHEVLEIIGDAAVNTWAEAESGFCYALELCDPVQGQEYEIDHVSVSNFVLPEYFDPFAPSGAKVDYLGTLSYPFQIAPTGYAVVRDPHGKLHNVFGAACRKQPSERMKRR